MGCWLRITQVRKVPRTAGSGAKAQQLRCLSTPAAPPIYSSSGRYAFLPASGRGSLLGQGKVGSDIDAFREAALQCPLPAVVELLAEKWTFLILRGAFNELKHFEEFQADRKSTRLNSSHANISYAVFCLQKKEQS